MKWDKVESGERAKDAVIHAQITAPSLDARKCRTLTQRPLMNVDYEVIDAIVSNPHAMMEKVFLILSGYYHFNQEHLLRMCLYDKANQHNKPPSGRDKLQISFSQSYLRASNGNV